MKQVKVSIEDKLRQLLEKSAKNRGASLSEEIRRRLWFSFTDGIPLNDIDGEWMKTAVTYNEAWLSQ